MNVFGQLCVRDMEDFIEEKFNILSSDVLDGFTRQPLHNDKQLDKQKIGPNHLGVFFHLKRLFIKNGRVSDHDEFCQISLIDA